MIYTYQYERNERRRDAGVEKSLKDVLCPEVGDSVMLAPGSVMSAISYHSSLTVVWRPITVAGSGRKNRGHRSIIRIRLSTTATRGCQGKLKG